MGVYAFGENCHGQCGQNPELRREVFGVYNIVIVIIYRFQTPDEELPLLRIPSSSPVTAVHCALDTSYVLTEAGEVSFFSYFGVSTVINFYEN